MRFSSVLVTILLCLAITSPVEAKIALPVTPTGFTYQAVPTGTLLKWSNQKSSIGYSCLVYRSTSPKTKGTMIKKLSCKNGNMLDISAKKNKVYYYSIQVQNLKSFSKLTKATKFVPKKISTTILKKELPTPSDVKISATPIPTTTVLIKTADIITPQPTISGGGGGGGGGSSQPVATPEPVVVSAPVSKQIPQTNTTVILEVPSSTIETIIPSSTTSTIVETTSTPPAPIVDTSEKTICSSASQRVVLIVDPNLSTQIQSNLTQFETDLCKEYSVIEKTKKFNSPQELRSYLKDIYDKSSLVGTILIGDFPRVYQNVSLSLDSPEEALSLQYYEDLDGNFSTSTNYQSPGNRTYSYDIHDGDVDWEIWVGVLPYYNGDIDATADAINRFLVKNHNYRTNGSLIPRAYAEIDELSGANPKDLAEYEQARTYLRSGQYSWSPFSLATTSKIYFNGDGVPEEFSISNAYKDLSLGVADFTEVGAHGYWGGSGKTDISWINNNPIKTIFYWNDACSVGNLDYQENFLSSVLYNQNSEVLVARGSTNSSGGMGSNTNGYFGHNIATSLTNGESIGQAIVNHVNVPLVSPYNKSREFHFALSIILGDPTLKLRQ
ncbi:MAG: hypothetical protein WCV83_02265 [Candidatus Magasanikbacteria bacterium]